MSELLSRQVANLSPEQQELLRRRLAETKQRDAQPAAFHELFESRVRNDPDRVAVAFGDEQLSYAALNRLANRLAHLLRERGVDRECLVGLCMPRSLEVIVGLLAILKAGGAYVPLDPEYPPDRLAYMISDSALPLVLTRRSVLDVLPEESQATVLAVEDFWSGLQKWPDTPVQPGGTVDDLAYVIYTSGSTGRPKGVQVTHRGFRNLARWQFDNYDLQSPRRVLQGTSLSFDISVWEMCAALLSGGTLVLPDPGLQMAGSDLADLLIEQGVENISLTPSALSTLPKEALPHVGYVTVGGEACPLDLVRVWAPGRAFFNGYGPTEATVGVSLARYEPDLERVHIGRPLNGMQAYVLDSRMQPLPVGVAGDLYVGGTGVARGYLGRPELTAEAFVANPFDAGSRLYQTGDVARLMPDGNVEFLGRADDQVKIRGFRVELGEIEAALAQHPDVRHAAVLLDEDGAAKRLVAFVVGGESVATEALQSFLGERLPHYMVPGVFVPLESMPLTTNRKVDRKALAALSWQEHAVAEQEHVAPRTPVEEELAQIWQAVLGTAQPVGVHDNFFSLGGDSILSQQVIFRAKQQGLYFTVKQLFRYQTITELAPVVEHQDAPPVQAEQCLVTGPVPLTPIQHWFFEQNFAHPHHVNQSLLLDVDAEVTPQQWEQVLRGLLEQHDGLRTRFFHQDGTWQAELAGLPTQLPWQVHDLTTVPADQRRTRLLEIAGQTQSSMHLAEPPLLRAALFTGVCEHESTGSGDHESAGSGELGPEGHKPSGPGGRTHRLLLVAHHLVVDTVSWRVLLEDLGTLVEQARQGQEPQLPAKSTSWR
ncbi:amino acid adenylation domain-containing protein, partial [Streptomyces diacarni]|uniref:amino acid adenylation domain-containing protein n=1 Tax=Streptomyces diacarni TaxID=2800381 RepID=UPI0033F76A63